MLRELKHSVAMFLVLTVLTGGVYPLLVWGLAQLGLHDAANGSFLVVDGRVRGSRWIGQEFDDPRWFWGRPSATTPPCNGASSSGSNLGPTNPALRAAVEARVERLLAGPHRAEPIPVDLVTMSASGLDPHVSPAAARWQVERVAAARGLAPDAVRALVERHVESPTFGVLGEARVNVLELNLALDRLR